jgi:hypothetical protein
VSGGFNTEDGMNLGDKDKFLGVMLLPMIDMCKVTIAAKDDMNSMQVG